MARRYSTAEKIEQLLATGWTQKEIAKVFKASTSSVRRWRAGVSEPGDKYARRLPRLTQAAAEAREEVRREARSQGIEFPKRVRVPVPARRLQRRKEITPRRIEYEPGRIIEFSVERMRPEAIFDLLWPYREQALARSRRKRIEPGSFRFLLREHPLAPAKPRRGEARGGPRYSAYVARLMYNKEREARRRRERARREGREPEPMPEVQPIYLSIPYSWTHVLEDQELIDLIRETIGERPDGRPQREIIAVRIYPPNI